MNQNPQTPSLPVAPPPPTWVSFDSDFKINIEWQTVPGAIAYDLEVSGQVSFLIFGVSFFNLKFTNFLNSLL